MNQQIFDLIVMALSGIVTALTSGGVIMFLLKKRDRTAELEKKVDRLAEGVSLGLENDVVIFRVFRNGHINGDSENQEIKMHEYFRKCTNDGFRISKEDKR